MAFWTPMAERRQNATGRRAPSILVVDDDRDTRELYRACFDLSGFFTAEAATGSDALEAANRLLPDVLLTDLILPDIDGFEVTGRLKREPATAAIRVILLTGYGIANFREKAVAVGVARALLKPCLPDAMLREVHRTLQLPA
jgi:two-component system, cell cycle response regulator DivK